MRILLLLSVLLPLHFCSFFDECVYEVEERERERRIDEESFGCRQCQPISRSAEENCVKGFECESAWQLTSNVLTPDQCACSEIKCADRKAKLAVDGEIVGKIRCKDHEWTLSSDPSIIAHSAVCAKACGERVCKPSHPDASKIDFSPLPVAVPTDLENCASAECPNGFAVLDPNGSFNSYLDDSSITCSSSGKWKTSGGEAYEYVMCNVLLPCQKCDKSRLLEPADGACSTQQDIFCKSKPQEATDASGCLALSCDANNELFFLQDDTNAQEVNVDEVKCDKGSWKVNGDEMPAGWKGFVCAILQCQACDQSHITDETNPACPTQNNIECKKKPMVASGPDDCPILYCVDDQQLYLITDTTNSMLVTSPQIKCDSGQWKHDGQDLPVGSIGFVCAIMLLPCQKCDKSRLLEETNPVCDDQIEIVCKSKPKEQAGDDGCPVLSCEDEDHQIYLINDATKSKQVSSDDVKCVQGIWKLDDVPINAEGFVCAVKKLTCADCHRNFLIEGSQQVPECSSQAEIQCTFKPEYHTDAFGCPILSCNGVNELYLLNDDTSSTKVNLDKITCDAGVWKVNDNDVSGAKGFVCAVKRTKCDNCKTEILLEPTHSPCFDQLNIMCTSKPSQQLVPCLELNCPSPEELYLLMDNTNSLLVGSANLKCSDGIWMINGAPMPQAALFACAMTRSSKQSANSISKCLEMEYWEECQNEMIDCNDHVEKGNGSYKCKDEGYALFVGNDEGATDEVAPDQQPLKCDEGSWTKKNGESIGITPTMYQCQKSLGSS